jgi:hypothetical protein
MRCNSGTAIKALLDTAPESQSGLCQQAGREARDKNPGNPVRGSLLNGGTDQPEKM